jgi:hypothetical protein
MGILQLLGLFDLENHILTPKNMKLEPIDIAVYYVAGAKNTYVRVHNFNFKSIHAELMKKRQFENETRIECQKWVCQSHVQRTIIGTDTGKSSVAAANDYWGVKNMTERLAYKYLRPPFTLRTQIRKRGNEKTRSRIIKLPK